MSERLQKLLANAGFGSRRQIETWIRAGRLSVNGATAALGDRAEIDADIRLDGQPLRAAPPTRREVLLYHKPVGEVTTRSDPQGRPTVFERLPAPRAGRWIAVGRLDVGTSGLLLFTNDGALAHRLMHPSSEIEREYLVRVRGAPDAATLERLRTGVALEDGPARFDHIEAHPAEGAHRWFNVRLHEGRNREVRRLWSAVGFEVSRLTRIRFGALTLPRDWPAGAYRPLTASELDQL